jgi:hypothetical protein
MIVEFAYNAGWNCAGSSKLYKRSGGHHGREDGSEHVDVMVRFLRCWDLSENCHSSSGIHTL